MKNFFILFKSIVITLVFCFSHSVLSAEPSKPIVSKSNSAEIEKGVPISGKGYIVFHSPDKTLTATVSALNENNESRLVIRNSSNKVLLTKNFSSKDTNHGSAIMRAAWSPDSKFFYFTMESSGGHQPWKVSSEFYSRAINQLFDLDEYLQPMGSINFSIQAPDIVTAFMWTKNLNGAYENILPITFHISDIKPHATAP